MGGEAPSGWSCSTMFPVSVRMRSAAGWICSGMGWCLFCGVKSMVDQFCPEQSNICPAKSRQRWEPRVSNFDCQTDNPKLRPWWGWDDQIGHHVLLTNWPTQILQRTHSLICFHMSMFVFLAHIDIYTVFTCLGAMAQSCLMMEPRLIKSHKSLVYL